MASDELEGASVKVRVKPASLEVLDELSDADRRELHRVMNREVLETAEFPEITLRQHGSGSGKTERRIFTVLNVRGRLALHGVSNEQDFVAQASLGVDSAARLRLIYAAAKRL